MAIILDGDVPTPGQGGAGPDPVKDTDTAAFMTDVIEASNEVPVIVDFWAPWCGPCKTLGPMLEKIVRQFGGKVRMVKVNVDENQQLAAQFRIQSIPAVYAFKGGQPVDGFMGALPESQLKQFVEKLLDGAGNPIDEALVQAKDLLDTGDAAAAQELFQHILQQDPGNPGAIAGLLRCFLAMGQQDMARQVLGQLSEDMLKNPEVAAVKTQIDLLDQGGGEVSALEEKVRAAPDDLQARHDLAMAYFAAGQKQEAVDTMLDIVRTDRNWNDGQAQAQLLKFFEAFGHSDPVTVAARRKLSSMLFS